MRRWLTWVVVLGLVLSAAGCAAKPEAPEQAVTRENGLAATLRVRSGTTGETIETTDPADIAHITENLEAMTFQDQGEALATGWSYVLTWLDGDGNALQKITLMGDGRTITHDGHFYKGTDGEIDLEFLEELLLAATQRNWGITLSVEDMEPTGLTLNISQSGEEQGEFSYGDEYTLKVLQDGQWEQVPYTTDEEVRPGCLWDVFSAGESREVKLSWEHLYGSLEAGIYRLSKPFTKDEGTTNHVSTTVSVEFTIP